MDTTLARVLIVDDDAASRRLLEVRLRALNCEVATAANGKEGLRALQKTLPALILLDLEMPQMGGMELLRTLRGDGIDLPVIVITSHSSIEKAVEAMREGAFDFIPKPLDANHLEIVVRKALERERLKRGTALLLEEADEQHQLVAGKSVKMSEAIETAKKAAASNATILLLGESGTGKEIFARAVHRWSERKEEPFVAINCVGLSRELLESELFGHEKGAFTGAVSAKAGLFEFADGGTVFLDEVAEMSPAMQAKLLQVLDTGELRRVGGTRLRRIDTRIFAATNKDLQQEVRAGRFREDLFFRLNVVSIEVPPLRDRREDIPRLVEHFLSQFRLPGQQAKSFSPEVLPYLVGYAWPGNVRELANTIERLVLLAPGAIIRSEDLPPNIRLTADLPPEEAEAPLPLAEVERRSIIRALRYTQGKKAPAARILGIDVKTLTHKIRAYNIQV